MDLQSESRAQPAARPGRRTLESRREHRPDLRHGQVPPVLLRRRGAVRDARAPGILGTRRLLGLDGARVGPAHLVQDGPVQPALRPPPDRRARAVRLAPTAHLRRRLRPSGERSAETGAGRRRCDPRGPGRAGRDRVQSAGRAGQGSPPISSNASAPRSRATRSRITPTGSTTTAANASRSRPRRRPTRTASSSRVASSSRTAKR